jgi:D-alanine--poly(phosphoribitol) ligase subunit 1
MQINISDYIIRSLEQTPDYIAIEDEWTSLSYLQLCEYSLVLSDYLFTAGIKKNLPVLILLPKSCEAIIGIVAVTFSASIYVPVDITSPIERLRSIYNQLGEALILCSEKTIKIAESLEKNKNKIVSINLLNNVNKRIFTDPLSLIRKVRLRTKEIIDQDPCYVIFTSGSTGTPKGVTIAHRSVIDYIEWAKTEYPVSSEHRLASQAPFYFDNSTLDLYLTFSTGASLFLPPENYYAYPKLILDYLTQKKITTIFWVPSVLVNLANSGLLEKIPPISLEHVLFAGEQMPVPQINKWVRILPGVLFSNLYGPTEITVDCTAYSFKEPFEGDVLPIGYACRNTDILILNQNQKECVASEIGELYVRGSSLALGYWNDNARTNNAFSQNPLETRFRDIVYRTGDLVRRNFSGCIEFVGRVDSQIKLNGYRIELGEIEAAATKINSIARNAAVFDVKRKLIVLFVEILPGCKLNLSIMRSEMAKFIPKYMIPSELFIVSTFDLNPNGKIDRLKLLMKLEAT